MKSVAISHLLILLIVTAVDDYLSDNHAGSQEEDIPMQRAEYLEEIKYVTNL